MNLNEQVAKALGWEQETQSPTLWRMPDGKLAHTSVEPRYRTQSVSATFTADRNAYHSHVIPDMVKHNLMDDWAEALCQIVNARVLHDERERYWGTNHEGVGITHLATLEQMCEAFLKVVQDYTE